MNEGYIYSRIDEAKATIEKAKKEHDLIVQKIKKLKSAYEQIGEIKKSLKSKVVKKDSELVKKKYSWKGNKYGSSGSNTQSFKKLGKNLNDANNKYYKAIDKIQDSINREINRLEIKKKGLLNLIWQQDAIVSTLRTELQNITN